MNCLKCGSTIVDGSKFCNQCGQKIEYSNTTYVQSDVPFAQNTYTYYHKPTVNINKVKEYILYGLNWLFVIVIIAMFVFMPIIVPKYYGEMLERLAFKYGSAASMVDIEYTFTELLEICIEGAESMNVYDSNDTIMLVAFWAIILSGIALLGGTIVVLIGLSKRDRIAVVDCGQAFVGISAFTIVITWIFPIIFNRCMGVNGAGDSSLKAGMAIYVLLIFIIIYGALIIPQYNKIKYNSEKEKNITDIYEEDEWDELV